MVSRAAASLFKIYIISVSQWHLWMETKHKKIPDNERQATEQLDLYHNDFLNDSQY